MACIAYSTSVNCVDVSVMLPVVLPVSLSCPATNVFPPGSVRPDDTLALAFPSV